MYQSDREPAPLTPQERLSCAILLLFILGLFAADVFTNYHPVKLSGFLIVLFWIPLLALHEVGHALAAAAVGWHVGQIVIGMGRVVSKFRMGTAVVEVRLVPVEGFVTCVPTNLNLPAVKNALIYFAGPGAELLLAVVLLFAIGPEQMFRVSDNYGLIVVQSLAAAAVAQGVLNLVPHGVWKGDRHIANDGLGIIRSFMIPESHYAAMIGQCYDDDKREWHGNEDAPADWWKRNSGNRD